MTFMTFSPREYLKIDIANSFGLDKELWEDRIAWFDAHEHELEKLVSQAEEPAMFFAGITAWNDIKEGRPSGYPISLDATCSGLQILAALACDRQTAEVCNVVDTGKREDAYTSLYEHMVSLIGESTKITRAMTKQAIMTAFYNSTKIPKETFGEGALLDAFYETLETQTPGAWEITQTMLSIWDDRAYVNAWIMPDNFHVIVKVMDRATENVHFFNEPFEVSYKVNRPVKNGRSLGANVVHSIDGMIVREMHRRCDYDPATVASVRWILDRTYHGSSTDRPQDKTLLALLEHFRRTGFLSARMISLIDMKNAGHLDQHSHQALLELLDTLPEKPFQLMSIHDCFRVLPRYGNDLRRQYTRLLHEVAKSTLLEDLVSQIIGRRITVNKMDPSLPVDILDTNYALS